MSDAPVGSLDMIFRPEVIARFADCGVTFLDSAEDVLQLALQYLHLDPNTTRPEDYAAAERLLLKVRPYVRSFDSIEYMNALANREVCIAMSWSADYATVMARARSAGVPVHLAFTVPVEGANQNYSSFLIPVGAPHPEAAYAFLNYILDPRVIAGITNEIYYGNANLAANAYVRPEILNDPNLYPTPDIQARLYPSREASIAVERIRTRIWTRIKTGR
jgi:putrescine transport system substrate-binding protein